MPIKDVEIKNISVGEVTKFIRNVVNAENVREENVECKVCRECHSDGTGNL